MKHNETKWNIKKLNETSKLRPQVRNMRHESTTKSLKGEVIIIIIMIEHVYVYWTCVPYLIVVFSVTRGADGSERPSTRDGASRGGGMISRGRMQEEEMNFDFSAGNELGGHLARVRRTNKQNP
jgi:hypothetical protein